MSASAILKYLSDSSNYDIEDQNIEMPQRAKKRRLDHLSWEEKLQRKKLKNRVAAQTSRDRKKARMEQMEKAIEDLFSRNESILSECKQLRKTNERLMAENAELKDRLKVPLSCASCKNNQNRSVECEIGHESGSTESSSLLLPQGPITHSAAALTLHNNNNNKTIALLKILIACLLYRTSSMNSTPMSISTPWNNLHKVSCRISPGTWKLLLKRQILKNQNLVEQTVLEKWWGRHQNNWNPMEVKC